MKLNHVNLPVADVSVTRDFFEKHFGFHCIAQPTDANVVLTDNGGLVLTISNFDHLDEVTYPKWFHVGFMQDSDDKVDEIYDRLKTAGMKSRKTGEYARGPDLLLHRSRGFYRRGVSSTSTFAFGRTVKLTPTGTELEGPQRVSNCSPRAALLKADIHSRCGK